MYQYKEHDLQKQNWCNNKIHNSIFYFEEIETENSASYSTSAIHFIYAIYTGLQIIVERTL